MGEIVIGSENQQWEITMNINKIEDAAAFWVVELFFMTGGLS